MFISMSSRDIEGDYVHLSQQRPLRDDASYSDECGQSFNSIYSSQTERLHFLARAKGPGMTLNLPPLAKATVYKYILSFPFGNISPLI